MRGLIKRPRTLLGLAAAPALAFGLSVLLTPFPDELRNSQNHASTRLLDRNGVLIHEVRASDGTLADAMPLSEMGERVKLAMVAAEDKRFYQHFGVDLMAVVRAAAQNLRAVRIRSGASTLTMQLARTLRPRPRSLWGKWREAALAVRIECGASKAEILEAYLNLAPFGANTRGVRRAAARAFGKEPKELSWAEAATLAGLPKSPVALKISDSFGPTIARRNVVLGRLAGAGALSDEELQLARAESLKPWSDAADAEAPHFASALFRGLLGQRPPTDGLRVLHSTIDGRLQAYAVAELRARLQRLKDKDVSAGAVLVIDNASGDVLSYVGSPDFSEPQSGQVDGVLAERQPGSALKPFVYALAMEKGGYTASTLLADVETRFQVGDDAVYAPKNYDGKFHGPVRVREALANSYNVPAVRAAEAVGKELLLVQLRALGFATLRRSADNYGIGLALGDGEVRLWDLAYAYVSLARFGESMTPRFVSAAEYTNGERVVVEPARGSRVIDASVAHVVADILADPVARANQFGRHGALEFDGYQVAAKTGTSKHSRDNWAVGFTREVTVAVWVGNFDGRPMRGTSGVTGAGPIMHAVMDRAMQGRRAAPLLIDETAADLERRAICPLSGLKPGDGCEHARMEWFAAGSAPERTCTMHIKAEVERSTGLLAGPACTPGQKESRVYENYDGETSNWARAAGRPLLPAASNHCPPATEMTSESFSMYSPRSGARFMLDPSRAQSAQGVHLKVGPLRAGEKVELFVDGRSTMKNAAPEELVWLLELGEHELKVQRANGEFAAARVLVR